jgi:hypothetical protein
MKSAAARRAHQPYQCKMPLLLPSYAQLIRLAQDLACCHSGNTNTVLALLLTWNAERIKLSSNSMTAPFKKSMDTVSHTTCTPSRSNTLYAAAVNTGKQGDAAAQKHR